MAAHPRRPDPRRHPASSPRWDFYADFGLAVDERAGQMVVRCDGRDQDQTSTSWRSARS